MRFRRAASEDAPVGDAKDAKGVEFFLSEDRVRIRDRKIEQIHSVVWKWRCDLGEHHVPETLTQSAPQFGGVDAYGLFVVRNGEADGNKFGVIGAAVWALFKVCLEFFEVPQLNGCGRVCAERVVDVKADDAEVRRLNGSVVFRRREVVGAVEAEYTRVNGALFEAKAK